MSKIKDDNFIVIPGWVLTRLNLKGNEILLYSIIYGFSQTEGQYFCGSLQYLQDWTNSTRQGVIKNLNHLVELGLIEKIDSQPTNKYRAIVLGESPIESIKESTTEEHNQNNYTKNKELSEKVSEIISYFNSVCSTKFKANTGLTKKLVKKHLDEGFTIDDFKRVIDLKYFDWGKTPVKFSSGQMSNEYLRPSTLFGDKFESYVYEAITRSSSETHTSTSVEVDPDISNVVF